MLTELDGDVKRLQYDGIDSVYRVELDYKPVGDYTERPMPYLVRLKDEKRMRRVYATQIGNVSVCYIKVKDELIYCEQALENALHRQVTVPRSIRNAHYSVVVPLMERNNQPVGLDGKVVAAYAQSQRMLFTPDEFREWFESFLQGDIDSYTFTAERL